MKPAPPLPSVSSKLRAQAERIQALTEEMVSGMEADDWGRVTSAEEERRPLLPQLIDAGFREVGGESADTWLRWILETDQEVMDRGQRVRQEMLEVRKEGVRMNRRARAYNDANGFGR